MQKNTTRPVHLNVLAMHFPLTAWVSIAHRLSGLWLFCMMPLLLFALEQSLLSASSFCQLKAVLSAPIYKILFLSLLAALCYHSVAGLRHMVMDFRRGTNKIKSTRSAALTIVITLVLFIGLAYRFL